MRELENYWERAAGVVDPTGRVAEQEVATIHQETTRYAHLAEDSVRESAQKIAASIADDILGGSAKPYEGGKSTGGNAAFLS